MGVSPAPLKVSTAEGAILRVEKISKQFGRIRALDQVSFEVRQGEVLGFLGPNGAGKTTTMRILAGYFPPSSGHVWIEGHDLFSAPEKYKKWIGYLPESVSLYQDMTVTEFLNFFAELRGVPKKQKKKELDEKIARCGLGDVQRRLIGPLSKGFKQRVGLAQALLGDPKLMILDEPTNGLDPQQIIEIRSLIRELGRERTVILSTHILPEVSMICDRVLIVNDGRVVASGTPRELEKELRSSQEIIVVLGDAKSGADAKDLLAALEGVEDIQSSVSEEGVRLTLAVRGEKDLRPVISRLCVEHQIPLLEIRTGRLSLEDIFMRLVVKEDRVGESS